MNKEFSQLTSRDNYFEDFTVGAVYKHSRGKTIEWLENVLITNLVMNTAAGNALEELGLDSIRLSKPVIHGDTLYAYTEVLSKSEGTRAHAGVVEFRHYGVNQRDELVAQVDRRALIKRRSNWNK